MATQAERLQKIRDKQNPDKATEEVLAHLSSFVKPVEVDIPLPVKGEDYFTEEDINGIVDIVRGMIKDGVDGIDGVGGKDGLPGKDGKDGLDGKDGRNGLDGESPNIDNIIKEVVSKIPKTKEVDTKAIIEKAIDAFKEEYKDDSLKLTALEKRLIRLGGGGASFLTQLGDVAIVDPSNNQVLKYNSSIGKWENGTPSGGGAVDSVNGQTGVVVVTKTDVGLSNVDNTSDTSKPVSTATQTALDLKLNISDVNNEDSFGIVVDGGGSALTTGSKGTKYIPFDCTITGWDIRSDVSGDCVFDVKRAGVSLAGTEKPTLSSASSNSDLALSTWTTSLTAGDVVEFIVDSASTLTRATVTILVNKI